MNNILNWLTRWGGIALACYVVSCILLTTLKAICEKNNVVSITEKKFENIFLIVITAFLFLCVIVIFWRVIAS